MQINSFRKNNLISIISNIETNSKKHNPQRCNHCGGAFKNGQDVVVCIMCNREFGHKCSNCTESLKK